MQNLLSRQTFDLNPMCEYVRLLAAGTVGLSSRITFDHTKAGTSPKQAGVLSPGTSDCSSVDADRSTACMDTSGEIVTDPSAS